MKLVARFGSLTLGLAVCAACSGADWITAPSYYTHDPQSGQRVDQYTPIGPFYTFGRSDYLQSGYRHTRSSIQAGTSVDHMHIVEEWGRPVRPYGEWRFPFRPYSVPYSLWGPPFAGMVSPWAWGPSGPGPGPGPGGGAGWGGDMDPYGRQQPPPYSDDTYAPFRSRPGDGGRPRGDHGD
jgi:hypothetical protein